MSGEATIDAEPRWALVGEPLYREVGDEVFVLTRDSQMHWLKNATARHLWELLVAAAAEGCTSSELARALSDEFEVDAEVAVADVVRFCEHLARQGLVAATTPAARPRTTPPSEVRPEGVDEVLGKPGRG